MFSLSFFLNLYDYWFFIVFLVRINSCFFILVLFLVFFIIIIFSFFYLNNYIFYFYFLYFLFLFSLRMIFFLIRKSSFFIYIFWDYLGVTSFFLVLYYIRLNSFFGSLKTIITNRWGDFFILVFLLMSDLEYSSYFMFFFSFLMIISGITKRGQVPFRVWLPEAMEAPTPVRALVHRSTLVVAGVWLIIIFFFEFKRIWNFFLILVGLITMFFSSFFAVLEKDFKKLVAWRTVSQIGFCFFIFSLGFYFFTFFHLVSHAFFKSLLFLQVGYFIFFSESSQDSRNGFFGNLRFCLFLQFFRSIFSLLALFFTGGIFSKDFILGLLTEGFESFFLLIFMILIIILTFFYSLKMLVFIFSFNSFFYSNKYLFNFLSFLLLLMSLYFISFLSINFLKPSLIFFYDFLLWFLFFIFIFIFYFVFFWILNVSVFIFFEKFLFSVSGSFFGFYNFFDYFFFNLFLFLEKNFFLRFLIKLRNNLKFFMIIVIIIMLIF